MDWDEEFALQDLLKNELENRNCWVPDRRGDGGSEETEDKLTDRGEEEDGEERWTVVEPGGEGEVRDTSTPLSVSVDAELEQRKVEEGRGECRHLENV